MKDLRVASLFLRASGELHRTYRMGYTRYVVSRHQHVKPSTTSAGGCQVRKIRTDTRTRTHQPIHPATRARTHAPDRCGEGTSETRNRHHRKQQRHPQQEQAQEQPNSLKTAGGCKNFRFTCVPRCRRYFRCGRRVLGGS